MFFNILLSDIKIKISIMMLKNIFSEYGVFNSFCYIYAVFLNRKATLNHPGNLNMYENRRV